MEIRLPTPHEGQRAVMSHPARFKWLAAGRRWRKTTLAMSIAVEKAAQGQHVLWCSPTFDQCRIGWGEMYKAAGGYAQFKLGRMEVLFPNGGGQVIFRSLDNPDNARGHTADGIVIDEAPMIKERAWYEVLRPIISDTDGWLLALGTPRGRNWFWREFKAADDYDDSIAWAVPTLGVAVKDGELVRQPHSLENSHFPFSEAVKLYATLPELIFGQEFLAHFIVRMGLVYGDFDSAVHVVARDPAEMKYWALAMDEGYTNPAVILCVGIDHDARVHVAREWYERGKLQEQVVAEALQMQHDLGGHTRVQVVVVDASAAGLIAEMRNAELPAQPHKGRVLDGIAAVQGLLRVQRDGRPRLTVDPSCKEMIAEFESYTWKEGKDEPMKRDDHAMDALRYLCDWLFVEEVELARVRYAPVRVGRW